MLTALARKESTTEEFMRDGVTHGLPCCPLTLQARASRAGEEEKQLHQMSLSLSLTFLHAPPFPSLPGFQCYNLAASGVGKPLFMGMTIHLYLPSSGRVTSAREDAAMWGRSGKVYDLLSPDIDN